MLKTMVSLWSDCSHRGLLVLIYRSILQVVLDPLPIELGLNLLWSGRSSGSIKKSLLVHKSLVQLDCLHRHVYDGYHLWTLTPQTVCIPFGFFLSRTKYFTSWSIELLLLVSLFLKWVMFTHTAIIAYVISPARLNTDAQTSCSRFVIIAREMHPCIIRNNSCPANAKLNNFLIRIVSSCRPNEWTLPRIIDSIVSDLRLGLR